MAKKKTPPLDDKPQRLNLSIERGDENSERIEPSLFVEEAAKAVPVDDSLKDAQEMDENSILTVGERLKFERGRKGYSLHEMADILRLRPRQIQALEEGDYGNLPGQAFVIGFLRSYANALGLDAIAIVDLYKNEHAGQLGTPQLAFPEPTSEGRLPGSGLLVGTCLLALLAFGGWYVYQNDSGEGLETVSELPDQLLAKLQAVAGSADTASEREAPTTLSTSRSETIGSLLTNAPVAEQNMADPENINPSESTALEATLPDISNQPVEETVDEEAVAEATDAAAPAVSDISSPRDHVAALLTHSSEMEKEEGQASVEQTEERVTESAETTVVELEATIAPEETNIRESNVSTEDTNAIENSASSSRMAVTKTDEVTAPATTEAPVTGEAVTAQEPDVLANVAIPLESKPAFEQEILTPEEQVQVITESGNNNAPESLGVQNSNARVVLMAHQESWVQILTANKEVIIERIFGPGDTFMVPALDNLKFNTANAAGIEIRVDGQKLSVLGGYGSIIQDLNLDPQSLRERYSISE